MVLKLTAWLGEQQVPGVSLARFDSQGLQELLCAGYSDLQTRQKVSENTGWGWFSVSKTLCALALVQTIQRGRISLEESLEKYLPDFSAYSRQGKRVFPTILQLANHSSGFYDPPPLTWLKRATDPQVPLEQRVRQTCRWLRYLHYAPGERFHYSNFNYLFIGALLQRIWGEDYVNYLDEHIFGPLELTGLTFGPQEFHQKYPQYSLAQAYLRRGTRYQRILELAGAVRARRHRVDSFQAYGPLRMDVAPAGGMVGTVSAVAELGSAHLREDPRVLAPKGFQSLFDSGPTLAPYGLAWWRDGANGYFHRGSGLGFCADLRIYPPKGLGYLAVCNRSGAVGPYFEPLSGLLDDFIRG